MWSEPRTRNAPPATKYLAVLRSCAPSSSSEYGRSRTGAARPGTNFAIAATTTAKNATYVRNCSDERCCRYTSSAEAGLQEVHDERPREVEDDEQEQDHPGADERPARVPDVLARVAV